MSQKKPDNSLLYLSDSEGGGLPFREYFGVIRKRLWTIVFVTAVGIGLGALYLSNQVPIYQAQATIEIRTETPQVLGGDIQPVIDPVAGARYWSTQEYFETQYRIIRSRSVAEEVVTALQLAEDLGFLGIDPEASAEARANAIEAIDPIAHLIGMISVVPVQESHLVQIVVENRDPELATQIANTLAEVYVGRNERRQQRGTDAAFHWLEVERASMRERVEEAEHDLLAFRQENSIHTVTLSARQQELSDRLASLEALLDEANADLRELQRERREVRRAREASEPEEVAVPAVVNNELIQNLKEQLENLRIEQARLEGRYGERHPDRVGVADAADTVREAIRREIDNVLASYEVPVERAEARVAQLSEDRGAVLDEMRALSQVEPEYNQRRRDIDNQADVLAMIERRYKETDLYRRQQDVNNIEVLDAAIVPDFPIRPRKRFTMAVAMLLGGLMGVAAAFLLEVLDNTVRTQEDVERTLGFTFLGVVPSIKSSQRDRARDRRQPVTEPVHRDLFIHANPKSSVAECCRSIRTNLHFMSPDKELRRLLVTSAGPREGKTSTAINLATVIAQSNHRVLLVDTDMRRPRLHKAFGMGNAVGMTSLILGEVDYEEAIQKTQVPNLDLLACGPIPPNPTELMHTDRFKHIVEQLSERYDRVIYDSPPVIAVADAMILGNTVDGVLFVIKSGQTAKDVVKRAKEQLEGINAPLLGAILNDLDLEDRAYRYHYYYSYYNRYGQYYEETPGIDEEADQPAGA